MSLTARMWICCCCCCVCSLFLQILLFNLPVNFAQGTSIFWAYVIGFHEAPLTAIQVLYVNMVTVSSTCDSPALFVGLPTRGKI